MPLTLKRTPLPESLRRGGAQLRKRVCRRDGSIYFQFDDGRAFNEEPTSWLVSATDMTHVVAVVRGPLHDSEQTRSFGFLADGTPFVFESGPEARFAFLNAGAGQPHWQPAPSQSYGFWGVSRSDLYALSWERDHGRIWWRGTDGWAEGQLFSYDSQLINAVPRRHAASGVAGLHFLVGGDSTWEFMARGDRLRFEMTSCSAESLSDVQVFSQDRALAFGYRAAGRFKYPLTVWEFFGKSWLGIPASSAYVDFATLQNDKANLLAWLSTTDVPTLGVQLGRTQSRFVRLEGDTAWWSAPPSTGDIFGAALGQWEKRPEVVLAPDRLVIAQRDMVWTSEPFLDIVSISEEGDPVPPR